MSRWDSKSGGAGGGPRFRRLSYLLALLQVLVLVGYFLPWHSYGEAMLAEIYSNLTPDSSESMVPMGIPLIACFVATAVSVLLVIHAVWSVDRTASAMRAVSLLTGFAVAGPLVYAQRLMGASPEWSQIPSLFDTQALGWPFAVVFGAAAGFVALYAYGQIGRSSMMERPSARGSLISSGNGPIGVILVTLCAFGAAIAVAGYFMVWSSGKTTSGAGTTEWTDGGLDLTPLMCIAPLVAVVAATLSLDRLVTRRTGMDVLLLAAQGLIVTGLSLTLFYGVILGEGGWSVMGGVAGWTLQPGWYVCVLGQALALACLLLLGWVGPRRSPQPGTA